MGTTGSRQDTFGEDLHQSKISDFNSAFFVHETIFQFQIAVSDAFRMEVSDAFARLHE
jgi:hypothetical protein